jgi:hypothetical protein
MIGNHAFLEMSWNDGEAMSPWTAHNEDFNDSVPQSRVAIA